MSPAGNRTIIRFKFGLGVALDAAEACGDPLTHHGSLLDAPGRQLAGQDLLEHDAHLLAGDGPGLEAGLLEGEANRAAGGQPIQVGRGLQLGADEIERRRIGHSPPPGAVRLPSIRVFPAPT